MLDTIQSWLTAHPDLARVALATVVFLIVYLVRKLAPSLWLRFEVLSPALNIESAWLSEQLHKLYQALPSAVLGAALGPLMTGGDWRQALLGALNGLAAPLSHELLSRYQGALGKVKQKTPPPSGGDVDGKVSLMPDPIREVAADRSRLHNDAPEEPEESRGWKHQAWKLALVGMLLAVFSCAGRAVSWPKVLSCAEPIEQPLIEEVAKVLSGAGDVQTDLEALVPRYAPGVLECAVQQIVGDLSTAPVTARASHQAARGRAFLAKVEQ